MTTLRALYPIAIMPGRNFLGTPTGISHELEARIRAFAQVHGSLPLLVLVPRELRPGEALSWQAFLTPGPHGPVSMGLATEAMPKSLAPEGDAKGAKSPARKQGAIQGQARVKKAPHRPRVTGPALDQEIASLGARGMGAESIVKLLAARGVLVSERTVARRLAQARPGELL